MQLHTHTSTWNETRHTHHDFHITNTLKGIVDSPISHLNEHFLDRFTEVLGVNTLRGPKLLGSCEFILIDVHKGVSVNRNQYALGMMRA